MGYFFLFLTVTCEVTGTTFMKLSDGFSKPLPAVAALACYLGTLSFMTLSLKHLSMSLVYATWSGLGITLVTVIGTMLFQESIQPIKLLWIVLIITGVTGLNLMKGA